MEVSKLTLSDELTHQTDLKTAVLVWLKEHPKAGYNTNCMKLAHTIGLSKDFKAHATTGSIDQSIRRLIKMGLIMRHNINLRHADFMVNYGHPDMPPFINEGVMIETKKEPVKPAISPNEVFRANGKTIAELIIEWMKANPMRLKRTTTGELADAIVASGKFQTTKESAQTVIGRLVREGRVQKFMCENRPRGKADFKVLDVKYEDPAETENSVIDWSPDWEYDIKSNVTPEEEAQITEDALDNSLREIAKEEGPFFKDLVREGMDPIHADELTRKKEEEKHMDNESTSTTQSIKMPDGGTINLTININIGK